ncbi:15350_t:CDS:2 [Gigaspora margarita]|uniref:3'(2'),5'-bisphosphate nucleotidase n=1 Tax=Gigaspora margarita TaxID=4874 RepID=A0ABN7UGP8_GIGMA|nr:15350_t:CDS:2 [Gigaspora margarita]
MSAFATERAVAIDAVLQASKICKTVFNTLVTSDTLVKKDKSPVTISDFSAQAVANTLLYKVFPDDPIVGEESSDDLKGDNGKEMRDKVLSLANSVLEIPLSEQELLEVIDRGTYAGGPNGRMWTIDPIDGTLGFLSGEKGQFAVGISLIIDGVVHLSVIGCPNYPADFKNPEGEKGIVFIAVKGQGAFQRTYSSTEETPIHMAEISSTSEATALGSLEADDADHDEHGKIASLLGMTKEPLRMHSMCRYCAVARGDANIYIRLPYNVNYEEKIWDHAPGSLLIAETGGIVTNMDGEPLNFTLGRTFGKPNKGFVIAHSNIHGQVLEAVQKVMYNK